MAGAPVMNAAETLAHSHTHPVLFSLSLSAAVRLSGAAGIPISPTIPYETLQSERSEPMAFLCVIPLGEVRWAVTFRWWHLAQEMPFPGKQGRCHCVQNLDQGRLASSPSTDKCTKNGLHSSHLGRPNYLQYNRYL